ncbi:MAG: hypothetical protein LBI17_02060 [Rickettsiales bacterium]|jgi:hypothetical protein|nr:hypothetical protein [Rickettsiales bacterium]
MKNRFALCLAAAILFPHAAGADIFMGSRTVDADMRALSNARDIREHNRVPPRPYANRSANYNMVDYDTLQSEREIRDTEIMDSIDKWNMGVKNVFWENYRGNNVRVEVLRNNRDLKEMRLKFVQSQAMAANPDGNISDMLGNVASKVMKSTCGRKARQAIVLYERPSVELVKETTYDYYKIIARGTSLKEYGFRCIY